MKKAGGEGLLVLKQVVMTFKRKLLLVIAMMKLMTRAHNETTICFNWLLRPCFPSDKFVVFGVFIAPVIIAVAQVPKRQLKMYSLNTV